jgi:hypothetical protein
MTAGSRALTFFDVLLAGAAVVIEGDETLHRPRRLVTIKPTRG